MNVEKPASRALPRSAGRLRLFAARLPVSLVFVLLVAACARRAPGPRAGGPLRGAWHRVAEGETVSGLAERYGVRQDDIAEINGLSDESVILAESELFIPEPTRDGKKPAPAPSPSAVPKRPANPKRALRWPVRGGGKLSSPFGPRWGRPHEGIDIAAPEGTDILAADDGRVIYSGVMRGYGKVVILEHAGRLVTVYAHNEKNLVSEGDTVQAGDEVALVGQTGKATGPHLHFEVRQGVVPVDPTPYLEDR